MSATILIIDDETSIRMALKIILEESYNVITAKSGSEAVSIYRQEKPDIALIDIGLPDIDGIEVLKELKKIDAEITAIMVTAVEDVKTIVEAVKNGAHDYLVKPVDSNNLQLTIQNSLENKRLKQKIAGIQTPMKSRYRFEIIGSDPKLMGMIETARKVSKSLDTPVLITGESGTGKGVLAKTIHYSSDCTPGPFITVNCGSISRDLVESELFGYEKGAFTGARSEGKKGRFEEAAGGTLFLDEIGAMPFSAQAKLLHVLEDKAFYRVGGSRLLHLSARIVAATNSDLENEIAKGDFRNDLYYRMNVVRLDVPPLRERPDDIMKLTQYFMEKYNSKFGKNFSKITKKAAGILKNYSWPGNIRELRNTIERIILLEDGNSINESNLPEIFQSDFRGQNKNSEINIDTVSLKYQEESREIIQHALKQSMGNITEAAGILGIPVHKLRYRIKKYQLS